MAARPIPLPLTVRCHLDFPTSSRTSIVLSIQLESGIPSLLLHTALCRKYAYMDISDLLVRHEKLVHLNENSKDNGRPRKMSSNSTTHQSSYSDGHIDASSGSMHRPLAQQPHLSPPQPSGPPPHINTSIPSINRRTCSRIVSQRPVRTSQITSCHRAAIRSPTIRDQRRAVRLATWICCPMLPWRARSIPYLRFWTDSHPIQRQ